ncbi:MAG: hypothetical protein NTZ21_17455 [Actinobacteria bacterium]|nr:hypothetical protein [Actinomycetota bacterium]
MSRPAKRLGLIAIAILAYYVILVGVWASRPLEDSVPVGLDWTPTVLVPPKGQQLVSQRVDCNTLFSGDARPDEPLPALTEQPKGRDALAFQREPCVLVHTDAQRNFAINTIAVVALLGGLGFVARRSKRDGEGDQVAAARTAVGAG